MKMIPKKLRFNSLLIKEFAKSISHSRKSNYNTRNISSILNFIHHRNFSNLTDNRNAHRIFISGENDIIFNLALESFLVDNRKLLNNNSNDLLLWRNDKTVVIGLHQNPYAECNLQNLKNNNVTLARRYSGGGTVYQDNGNTCFSFISPPEKNFKEMNNEIILNSLKNFFGVDVESTGKNDIVYKGKKFSGAAYRQLFHCCLHHGTIMRDVDLSMLDKILTPNALKLKSKGIRSVQSRVMNLCEVLPEISHESIMNAIISEFEKKLSSGTVGFEKIHVMKNSPFLQNEIFLKHYNLLSSWEWRYGKAPEFQITIETRFPWASMECHFNIVNGCISEAKIFTDCNCIELANTLNSALIGVKYDPIELSEAVISMGKSTNHEMRGMYKDIAEWLSETV